MAEELFIPKMGQTVEEVTIINWFVKDGDKVEQGQELLEVETDKAVFSVEGTASGYIHIGPYKVGNVVPILTVVAVIGEQDEAFQVPKSIEPGMEEKETLTIAEDSAAVEIKPQAIVPGTQAKILISPRAKKLAKQKQVDIEKVTPTGDSGLRIVEKDVLAYLDRRAEVSPVEKSIPAVPPLPESEVLERIPLKGIRGLIAERMLASAHTTAKVTLLMEADATKLVALREKLKTEVEKKWGFTPGYNDFLVKIVARALRRFPYMNARLSQGMIERLARIHIGIAVDAEASLYVPVIKDVDQKDLHTVGKEFRQRIEEIRNGTIKPDDLRGGTFTVTNLGSYDVQGFTPVINLPELAILGVGKIDSKPVVREGQVIIRKIVTLSLVFDHRLVDGAPAAQFLQYIKELIETPNEVMRTK
ncbi:MAG TPA: 2-oxo acid dehydrogenase subunit E2 [Anaerolineae bacterium]|nr:2-oxo acid dehydrogenase subunit E2 [Anaerolineae bacterium]